MYSWFREMGGGGAFVSTEIDKPHIGLQTISANSTVLACLLRAQCRLQYLQVRAHQHILALLCLLLSIDSGRASYVDPVLKFRPVLQVPSSKGFLNCHFYTQYIYFTT
jgi:uncharacterized membrane protein